MADYQEGFIELEQWQKAMQTKIETCITCGKLPNRKQCEHGRHVLICKNPDCDDPMYTTPGTSWEVVAAWNTYKYLDRMRLRAEASIKEHANETQTRSTSVC